MTHIADIPAPPLTLSTDVEDLLGTKIEIKLVGGEKLTASLLEVNGLQQKITVMEPHAKQPKQLPFSDVRVMHFVDLVLTANDDYPLAHHDSNIVLASSNQDYELFYLDGAHQQGQTNSWVVDEYALHLFARISDDVCSRIFIPLCVLSSYSIGPITRNLKVEISDDESTPGIVSNARQLIDVLEHNHHFNAAFGKILVEKKLITNSQLENALSVQKKDKSKKLGDILKEQNLITSSELHQALAMQLGLPFINLRDFEVEQGVLTILSHDFAHGYKVMPLMKHDGHLVIAISNPANTEVINLLRFTTGDNVEVVVATEEDIQWAIEHYYGDYATNQAMEELDKLRDGNDLDNNLQQHEL